MPGIDQRIWFQQARDRTLWAHAVKNFDIVPQTRNTERADRHLLQPQRRGAAAKAAPVDLRCPTAGCNFVAKNSQGLRRHITDKHTVNRSFTCTFCNAEFTYKASLTKHLKHCGDNADEEEPGRAGARSAGARPHVCPDAHCGLTFMTIFALNKHKRDQCLARPGSGAVLRNGVWQLACVHCGRWFNTKAALGIHVSRQH